MTCYSCGKNVPYPRMENDSRYGRGWRCTCGWFNKKRSSGSASCQAPRRKGCPLCGSVNITATGNSRLIFNEFIYQTHCNDCNFYWYVDSLGRPT